MLEHAAKGAHGSVMGDAAALVFSGPTIPYEDYASVRLGRRHVPRAHDLLPRVPYGTLLDPT